MAAAKLGAAIDGEEGFPGAGGRVALDGTATLEKVVIQEHHTGDSNGFGCDGCLDWNRELKLVSIGQQFSDALREVRCTEFSDVSNDDWFAFLVQRGRVLDVEVDITAQLADEMRTGDPVERHAWVATGDFVGCSIVQEELWPAAASAAWLLYGAKLLAGNGHNVPLLLALAARAPGATAASERTLNVEDGGVGLGIGDNESHFVERIEAGSAAHVFATAARLLDEEQVTGVTRSLPVCGGGAAVIHVVHVLLRAASVTHLIGQSLEQIDTLLNVQVGYVFEA